MEAADRLEILSHPRLQIFTIIREDAWLATWMQRLSCLFPIQFINANNVSVVVQTIIANAIFQVFSLD